MFADAGFARVSANIGGWMLGHSAFVVPIGFALYRFGSNPTALAADASTLRLMVRATREAFEALDDLEIPANLRWLYLRMPTALAVRYWHFSVFGQPSSGCAFVHAATPLPTRCTRSLTCSGRLLLRTCRKTPNLDALLGTQ